MNARGMRAGVAVVTLLLLAGCMGQAFRWGGRPFTREYSSNGERIYFTGTSRSNTRVRYTMDDGSRFRNGPMMGRMMGGTIACADCHGPNGRGGTVQMMMTSFAAPDIRYETLTAADHAHNEDDDHTDEPEGDQAAGHEADEHPPDTDATLARAITQGVDPAGEPLDPWMPRWSMSQEDLDDLIAYLKTLD